MRGRSLFIVFGLISIFFACIMIASEANAPIAFNMPPPPNPGKGTEEGGALVFRSFAKLFIIFEALEHGNISEANNGLAEVRALQSGAIDIYKDFASQIPSTLRGRANLTDEKIKMIKKEFKFYKLEIPTSYGELANFAYKEVNDLSEFMSKISFTDDPVRNRQIVREIVDRIYRYMRVGISVAEIAASWTMKQQ